MTTAIKKLRIVFYAAIGVLVFLFIISYLKINSFVNAVVLVQQNTQLTQELEKVNSNNKDIDKSISSYLLTNDNAYLQSYNNGIIALSKNIKTVKQLIVKNSEQKNRVAVIEKLAMQRINASQKLLQINEQQKLIRVNFLLEKVILDSLQSEVDYIIAEEKNLLNTKMNQLRKKQIVIPILFLILILSIIIFIAASYWQLKKAFNKSNQLKINALKENLEAEKIKEIQAIEKRNYSMLNLSLFSFGVLKGNDLIIAFANNAIKNVWGKGNDIEGKPFLEILPELIGTDFPDLIRTVMLTGVPFYGYDMLAKLFIKGQLEDCYFNFVYQPYYEVDGSITGITIIAIEVTKEVIAKKQIEENENWFRNLIEYAPVAMCVYKGEEYVFKIANEKHLQLVGKTKEQVINLPVFTVVPEGVEQGYKAVFDSVYKTGKRYTANESTFTITRNEKEETIYVNYICEPLYNSEKKIDGIFTVATDVTEQVLARKKIEEGTKEILDIKAQLDLSIAAGKIGIWHWDVAKDILTWTSEQKELYGLKPTENINNFATFKAMVFEEDWEKNFKEAPTKILESVIEYDFRIIRKNDAQIRWIKARAKNIFNDKGDLIYINGVNIDITEQIIALNKLKESEAFNKAILDNSPDCIKILDAEGKLQFMNTNGICLLEIDDFKTIQNTFWWDMWEPHNQQIIKDAVAAANNGEKIQFQLFSPTAKNTSKWWDIIVVPVYYEQANKKVYSILSVSRDITEQKLSQLKEKEALTKFQNLVLQAPVAVSVLQGKNFVVEVANQKQLELWGKTKLEVLNKPLFASIPEEKEQRFEEILNKVLNTGIAFKANESPLTVLRNGVSETIFVNFIYQPIHNAVQQIEAIISIATEVTEQVLIRKKIEESEERFRMLTQTLPQLVWVTDAEGKAEFTSNRWKEYSGIEPATEKEWKAIVHPDDYENINDAFLKCLSNGNIYTHDVRLKNKEGIYRWHTVVGVPVLSTENKIIKWVGSFTDTHQDKLFTQELEQQVIQRTKELEISNVELIRKNKELESFAYISSHDLQEPLRKIQTYSSVLLDTEVNNISLKGKGIFNRILSSANRMQTLIQDLLIYSKTNVIDRKFENINFHTLINEVLDDLSEEISKKSAIIELGNSVFINIIPFQFRQLLQNLISNAIKFTLPTTIPHIKIESKIAKGNTLNNELLIPEKNYCYITITDNGIGFEQQYSEKIFDIFQRLHGKNEYVGTGIGLSIVKKILDNHGGFITAKGELNKGSTFNIFIPV